MKAMTVSGAIDVAQLGVTLPHEHVMFNTTMFAQEPVEPWKMEIARRPVSMASVGELRRDPMICRDNLLLDDEDVAVREIEAFREAGGSTIVDVSSVGLRIVGSGTVSAVARVAERAGVNIIAGTGCYLAFTHPPDFATQSVEEIARWMVSELNDGIEDTGIRAGIIGELGVSDGGMHPQEEKMLRAAAYAQTETGAAITIHNAIPHERQGMRVLGVLKESGADLSRVIMGHMTQSVPDRHYHRTIADTGAVLEFDRFGSEFYNDSWGGKNYCEQRDVDVVAEIAALIREGYGDRILMSHDVGFKVQLSSYGGLGYAHILRRVVRYLANLDVPPEAIHQMTVLTPARLLGNERLRSAGCAPQVEKAIA